PVRAESSWGPAAANPELDRHYGFSGLPAPRTGSQAARERVVRVSGGGPDEPGESHRSGVRGLSVLADEPGADPVHRGLPWNDLVAGYVGRWAAGAVWAAVDEQRESAAERGCGTAGPDGMGVSADG